MKPTLVQLQRLEPIRGLSASRLAELAERSVCRRLPAGADALAVDAGGPVLRYLVDGELRIVLPDGASQVLVGGCDVANWPLGYRTAPALSSRAITEVLMLTLDFELLDLMMTWDELAQFAVSEPGCPAAAAGEVVGSEVLGGSLLAHLPSAHIHELLRRFERVRVRRGESIVREGEPGDYYYLIESGTCVVSRLVGGDPLVVAELRPGQAFGEEALVADMPRGASVSMKTDGLLLRLAKPDFLELLKAPLLHPVDWSTAARRVAAGEARWLDVRYPAEFVEDGLPGAVNVPLNEIRHAFTLLDRSLEYIVYCQSGRRSSAAAFLLAREGFNAWWLDGGLGQSEKP